MNINELLKRKRLKKLVLNGCERAQRVREILAYPSLGNDGRTSCFCLDISRKEDRDVMVKVKVCITAISERKIRNFWEGNTVTEVVGSRTALPVPRRE